MIFIFVVWFSILLRAFGCGHFFSHLVCLPFCLLLNLGDWSGVGHTYAYTRKYRCTHTHTHTHTHTCTRAGTYKLIFSLFLFCCCCCCWFLFLFLFFCAYVYRVNFENKWTKSARHRPSRFDTHPYISPPQPSTPTPHPASSSFTPHPFTHLSSSSLFFTPNLLFYPLTPPHPPSPLTPSASSFTLTLIPHLHTYSLHSPSYSFFPALMPHHHHTYTLTHTHIHHHNHHHHPHTHAHHHHHHHTHAHTRARLLCFPFFLLAGWLAGWGGWHFFWGFSYGYLGGWLDGCVVYAREASKLVINKVNVAISLLHAPRDPARTRL